MLFVGDIPEGKCVCHSCDNTKCVNPIHLFLGSQLDNVRDRVTKGRGCQDKGEASSGAKLTGEEVIKIREMVEFGCLQREVARRFGVSPGTISHIICGDTWKGCV